MSEVLRLVHAGLSLGPARGSVQALRGVSLRIDAGERVAFIGANGSGKSSLLRLMHGLLAPSEGVVQRATGLQHAMVFQRPHLLRLSVQHNVALGLWLHGVPWAQARSRALAALERVGMDALAQRRGHTLSGGQQQRVALARAWALHPQVLLLDEPTANLDPHAKKDVEALIARFALETGATLLLASHNLGQVKRLATRVVYLEQGSVFADLPVADFFKADLLRGVSPEAHTFVKGETP